MNPISAPENDLETTLAILNRCAVHDFHTACDQELLAAFAGRGEALASTLGGLSTSITELIRDPDDQPWMKAVSAPPRSALINMLSKADAQAHSAQERWGEHVLSLKPLGFSPDAPYQWINTARSGQLSSLLAIEAVVGSMGLDDFPFADSNGDREQGYAGIALAFAKDGPEEIALVSKFLAQGRFSSRYPVLSVTDLFVGQANGCAQAVIDAGIPIGPALFGPHGEHGLHPPAALAARHLWMIEYFGPTENTQIRQYLQSKLDSTCRSIASFSASKLLGCGKFDTLAELQTVRLRRARKEKDHTLSNPDLDAIFFKTCALPSDDSDPRGFAQATGKLLGASFFYDNQESGTIDLSTQGPAWKSFAKAEIERAQSAGIRLGDYADTLCAHAMASAYGYRIEARARDEICSMIMDTLSDYLETPASGPECLHWLACDGRLRLATHLFEKGCAADFDDPNRGNILHELAETPTKIARSLFLAVVERHPELAALPARGGYHKGREPIHLASKQLDSSMIEALIHAGASPNATDSEGQTPLRYLLSKRGAAAEKTSHIVAKKLIDAGADPELSDARGRTPAQAAAKTASFTALAMLFSKKPMDILARGSAASLARTKIKSRIGGRNLIEQIDIQDTLEKSDTSASTRGSSRNRI